MLALDVVKELEQNRSDYWFNRNSALGILICSFTTKSGTGERLVFTGAVFAGGSSTTNSQYEEATAVANRALLDYVEKMFNQQG